MSSKAPHPAHESEILEKPLCKAPGEIARLLQSTHQTASAPFGVALRGSALLTPEEAGGMLGYQRDFVYGLIDEGRLEAHRTPGRKKPHIRVTRRSLVAFAATSATYQGEDFFSAVLYMAGTLSETQRLALVARIEKGGRW